MDLGLKEDCVAEKCFGLFHLQIPLKIIATARHH